LLGGRAGVVQLAGLAALMAAPLSVDRSGGAGA